MAELSEEDMQNMSPEQIAEFQKQSCMFCKIISGEIPSKKVYDDPEFIGILDINPAAEGHVLLLPKKHAQILPHIHPDIVGKLGAACRNISQKMLKGFGVEGTTIFIANSGAAGQKSPHLIIHIIPRKENDGLPLNPSLKELDDASFNDAKAKIIAAMGVAPPEQSKKNEPQPPNEEDTDEEDNEDNSEEEEKPDLDEISKLFT